MTDNQILIGWLERLQALKVPLYLGQDDIDHWPGGLLEVLVDTGVIKKATPANTLDCRGCAWGCHKAVQWLPNHQDAPARAFILCDEEPAQGRIPVRPERLQQWQTSPESLAQWLADQVGNLSKAEILQALPDLPFHKILRLEGLTPYIDKAALDRAMHIQGTTTTKAQESSTNRIYLSGDFWMVTFNGQTQPLKNRKGMRVIAYLIQQQGRYCHAFEIEQNTDPSVKVSEYGWLLNGMKADQLEELGLSTTMGEDGFEIFDAQAKTSIRKELKQLEDQIEEAKELGDIERQAKLEDQWDSIDQQLNAGLGMGGQSRRSGDAAEKARKRILRVISEEKKKLKKAFPDFATHLAFLESGTECHYRPDPAQHWLFEP